MSAEFVARFRTLHAEAKKARLGRLEQREYDLLKDRLATALCVAQQILVPPGQHARATFRVAVLFKVEVTIDGARQSTATMDLSMGGFSAPVPMQPKQANKDVPFKFLLAKAEVLSGTCEIVGVQRQGTSCRASFRFTTWSEGHAAKLEEALFDAVVARFK